MTMYFPPTPSDGDPYENNGVTYIYDAATNTWNAVSSVPGESYTKAEADAKFVEVAGDAMTGTLSMGNNPIQNLATATSDYEAANLFNVKEEAGKKVDKQGDVMTGDLEMSGHKVMEIANPTLEDDAVNKRYSDAEDKKLEDKKVDRAGDVMSGNLVLQDASGDPLPITALSHATTKEYVDEAIANNVANPLTYHGKIDATQTGPTSIPVEAGDFYIHDTDGNYSPGEIEVLWGFPPGTEIEDLDRLLYDGTAWAILHTAGDYVSKVGGDTMEGPLRITNQDGDSDQTNSRIYTYSISSPGASNLELKNNSNTKMYIGSSTVSVNVPFQANQINPQGSAITTKYTGLVNDPQSIATKQYIDTQFAGRLGELRFRYGNSSFNDGDFRVATSLGGSYVNAPVAAEDIQVINTSKVDYNGNTIDPSTLFGYISLTKNGGQAFYLILSVNTGANDIEIYVNHTLGAGFNFVQDDLFIIEPANQLLMTELFVNKFTPEMRGDVNIIDASLTLDRSSNTSGSVIGFEVKANPDDGVTGGQEVRHKFGNPGNNGSHNFEFGGYGYNKTIRIQGKSGGTQDLLVFDTSGRRLTNSIEVVDIGGMRLTNVAPPTDDDDIVSLGYITEKLQDKFDEVIGQSAQGNYLPANMAITSPGPGEICGFENGNTMNIMGNNYDPEKIVEFRFNVRDLDNHTVDFTTLSVGDYLVLMLDKSAGGEQNNLTRFRVESTPTTYGSATVYSIDVSYSSGWPGGNADGGTLSSEIPVIFQKISGSVDLDDYVKVDGTNEMTGTLTVNLASGNAIEVKQNNNLKFSVASSGQVTVQNSIDLAGGLDFQSGSGDSRYIKIDNNNRIQISNQDRGGTVVVMRPGDDTEGFIIKGVNSGGNSIDLLRTYHGVSGNTDIIHYLGSTEQPTSVATMGKVDERLKIDGSEPMTGHLTVKTPDASITLNGEDGSTTGKEAELIFMGNRTGNSNPIGSLHFENKSSTQTGVLGFHSEQTNDFLNSFFKSTHNIHVVSEENNTESKFLVSGHKTDNTKGFGTLEFINRTGISTSSYILCMGSSNASRKFEFTAPITVRRSLAGDSQDNTILQGRVGNTTDLKGKLLSVYTNSGANGGDAVNYYGKTSGGTNIQTLNSMITNAKGLPVIHDDASKTPVNGFYKSGGNLYVKL